MKKLIPTLIFIISFIGIYAQNDSDTIVFKKKNTLYVELLGTSAAFPAINYDRIFYESKHFYLNVNAGIGNIYSTVYWTFPVSANITYGKKSHHLELGLGVTPNYSSDDRRNFFRVLGSLRAGYKYQRPQGGFFLKAAFTATPILFYINDTDSRHGEGGWFNNLELGFNIIGLSLGYSF